MQYVDEFRDPGKARALAARIAALAGDRPLAVMEICGGHTHVISRYALADLLPPTLTLVHGPGCPVCVLPAGRLDDALALARHPGVILTTFGDLLRVPGRAGTFLDARAEGADIRAVYSPLDALRLAVDTPDRHVAFVAIGFETTAPSTATALLEAERLGLRNFSVFCNHVVLLPAMEALLASPDLRLDGFIGPGHVSTVIGCAPYEVIPRRYRRPVVVAGFEPLDLLEALRMLLAQLAEGRCEVESQYGRAVPWEGNPRARAAIDETMTLRDTFEWRGLGAIPRSALRLRDRFAAFDAEARFALPGARVEDPRACQCGAVLRGALKPWECKVFGTACTPERPLGACMVSAEGACAAHYRFGRHARGRTDAASGAA